jgi:predicted Zn-dependent protease
MSQVNWLEALGWGHQQLSDLRCAAWSHLRQGQYKKALILLEALTILAPDDAYAFREVGALYLQLGDSMKAIEWLDQALLLDPAHLPSQVNKAKALLLLGYRNEGLALAHSLAQSADRLIQDRSTALVMAYS